MKKLRNHRVAMVSAFAGLLFVSSPVLAADTPEELVRAARACKGSQGCLTRHVSERVYFPHARKLLEASPECAAAFAAAKARDGYGWYLTADEFLECMLSASEPFPGSNVLPRTALAQCIEGAAIEHEQSSSFARLIGAEFFCELEHQPRGWVITQILQKP